MTDSTGAIATPTEPTTTRWQRWGDRLATLRMNRLGLRTRVLLMFSLGSLLLAIFLSGAAYSFTRSSLVTQRDQVGVEGATRNATLASAELAARPGDAGIGGGRVVGRPRLPVARGVEVLVVVEPLQPRRER